MYIAFDSPVACKYLDDQLWLAMDLRRCFTSTWFEVFRRNVVDVVTLDSTVGD
jgi:hypothetical protein